jgi:hypothetical protein
MASMVGDLTDIPFGIIEPCEIRRSNGMRRRMKLELEKILSLLTF